MQSPRNIVLFASGSGSNVENIASYFREDPRVQIKGVLCNNPGAGVVERCKRLGLPLFCFNRAAYQQPDGLLQLLRGLNPDLIVLAGFLWKIPEELVGAFPEKIINIHPALLPKFGGKGMYGMHVHRAVIENGEKESGITVHFVNEAYDEGAVILQKKVVIAEGETPESLAGKIHELEYEYYPQVIGNLLFGYPMAKKSKFYVVWKGKNPGIYDTWTACKKEIQGVEGARYMGFPDRKEAEAAFRKSFEEIRKTRKKKPGADQEALARIGPPNYNSIAVDAASSGNPGVMEYRGVDTRSGKKLFAQGPFPEGTNNIGEFLAIVHGLAYLKKRNSQRVIYTDSRTAISWVKKKKCNTRLKESEKNRELFELIRRAENWLQNNSYTTPVVKWETRAWGEIPADFGRK